MVSILPNIYFCMLGGGGHILICFMFKIYRLRAKKGPAPPPPPPLGNFADISYLEENFKPHLLRDVCTLCSGALVSDSLLHMLL